MTHIPSRIEELEKELSLAEQVYEAALLRVSGEDEEWAARKSSMIDRMCRLISTFKVEDQPSKAVAIMGQMMPMVAEILAPEKIVHEYEAKRRRLIHYREEQEKRTTATENAKKAYEQTKATWNRKRTA